MPKIHKNKFQKLSYKWFVPFTHTIETVGMKNEDTFQVTPNDLWKNVTWLYANVTTSKEKLFCLSLDILLKYFINQQL